MLPVFPAIENIKPAARELHRWPVAQRRVQPLPVVKHFDIFKCQSDRLIPHLETFAMNALVFEAAEPAFGRGIGVPISQRCRLNSGRNFTPIHTPGNAAASHSQPCTLVEAMPE